MIVMASTVEINDLETRTLDLVAPLWAALHEHHMAVGSQIAEVMQPVNAPESWLRRRSLYQRWLAEPEAFGLIARHANRPVGYAFVRVQAAETGTTWERSGEVAVLETLSVLPAFRGVGVGEALLSAVRTQLVNRGIVYLDLDVVATNQHAIRFYERHGFRPELTRMTSRIAGDHEGAR